ncbi:transglutaminase family protein [Yinghuangia seranimata]|uniref:transglutaminase family protein n=1 Tax=Yinghuangia seranimata TaxID=408067 RepID=UPI00248BFC2C|nr:transglutaminase family protein [Yinghuangia seranimata]MDI2125187.1 transglutaminase family protein [Yinghuangia seranimata]
MTTATGWRLGIRHVTEVAYSSPARASFNEVRMAPLTLLTQTALESRLEVDRAAHTYTYHDYWGTQVVAVDVAEPHTLLRFTARATVETSAAPPLCDAPDWDAARGPGAGPQVEYTAPTPLTEISADAGAHAVRVAEGLPPHEAAAAVAAWVHRHVAYVPGATGVGTDAQQAFDQRAGVCQDIAQLTVAMLRTLGLPARYVSGYFHPSPEAAPGDTVVGQSHAWVEYWAGDWTALDPTNLTEVGVRHVVVGRGRDYADVPPFKGVYQGAPGEPPKVTVELTRLA